MFRRLYKKLNWVKPDTRDAEITIPEALVVETPVKMEEPVPAPAEKITVEALDAEVTPIWAETLLNNRKRRKPVEVLIIENPLYASMRFKNTKNEEEEIFEITGFSGKNTLLSISSSGKKTKKGHINTEKFRKKL